MGGDNALSRVMGEWSLEEVLNLIQSIEIATDVKILKDKVKISLKIKDKDSEEFHDPKFVLKESKLTIYSRSVKF